MQENTNLNHLLPKKVRRSHIEIAERLYNFIPQVCWMTEVNLAKALDVSPRQIKIAKAYLEDNGKIEIELRENGKRSNPIHTLIKPFPINQNSANEMSIVNESSVDWTPFNQMTIKTISELPIEDQLELYEQMRLPFIPLHFPKFDRYEKPFCSCRSGHNCPYIGKHPATSYKSLDFSDKQTFKAMKGYWLEKDMRYNIGFIVDGFVVIDVDYRHGGQYSLELLQEIYGELPQNLIVKTGNGFHYYALGNKYINNGTEILGFRGIDIRSNGSFIVAPFSQHHSGNYYEWYSLSSPEPLPQYLITDLQDVKQMQGQIKAVKNNDGSTLPKVIDSNFRISNGNRNTTLFKLACRERGKGAEQTEISNFLTEINAKNCQTPQDEQELQGIVKSVMRYPSEREKRAA